MVISYTECEKLQPSTFVVLSTVQSCIFSVSSDSRILLHFVILVSSPVPSSRPLPQRVRKGPEDEATIIY